MDFHTRFSIRISAAYLDVIPIIAVPLRLISPLLPADFQYFGLYLVLCLILQAYFGFRLTSRFTSDKIIILLGGLFFLNAPILLGRLYVHFSLCSQWLILAAVYHYFAPKGELNSRRYFIPFALLLAISAGVTPYLAAMVLLIGFAAILRACSESPISVSRIAGPVIWGCIMLAVMAVSLLMFGFVVPVRIPFSRVMGTPCSPSVFSPPSTDTISFPGPASKDSTISDWACCSLLQSALRAGRG